MKTGSNFRLIKYCFSEIIKMFSNSASSVNLGSQHVPMYVSPDNMVVLVTA